MDGLSHLFAGGSSLDYLVRRYCTLPNPIVSYEQAERWEHRDLDSPAGADLRQELKVLRFWLHFQSTPHPWFAERVKRIREHLRHAH